MSKVERRDFLGALLGCSGVAAVSGATPLLQAGTLVQI
ncbi:MAG: twin-arginine translocation signal domain-containing protein, partial [Pseudohongiellaceae bacterium]